MLFILLMVALVAILGYFAVNLDRFFPPVSPREKRLEKKLDKANKELVEAEYEAEIDRKVAAVNKLKSEIKKEQEIYDR